MGGRNDTRRKIVEAASDIVRSGGPGDLTFDAVAKRLGLSKQAVLYWFPRKEDLIAGVALPALRDEAQAGLAAMEDTVDAHAAVAAFITAVGEFHFADIDRFRLMYVSPHLGAKPAVDIMGSLAAQIHSLTSSMYDALQARLTEARGLPAPEARRGAVAIHMAVLGLVTMVSLTEAMGDPLLHDRRDLLDTMARLLSR